MKQHKKPTSGEINQHLLGEGRSNGAINALTKLVKEKKLKGEPLKGQRAGAAIYLLEMFRALRRRDANAAGRGGRCSQSLFPFAFTQWLNAPIACCCTFRIQILFPQKA